MACQCDMTCECAQDEVRGGLEAWGQVAGLLSSGIGALLRVAVFLEFPCFSCLCFSCLCLLGGGSPQALATDMRAMTHTVCAYTTGGLLGYGTARIGRY